MKTLIGIVILALFLGCNHVPSQDIIARFMTEYGVMYLKIEKGALDEKWHGSGWWTVEEIMDVYKEMKKEEEDADKTPS